MAMAEMDAEMTMPEMAAHAGHTGPGAPPSEPVPHGTDTHGPGNAAVPDVTRSRLDDPGVGLSDTEWRVLLYSDLRGLESLPDNPYPTLPQFPFLENSYILTLYPTLA